MSMLYTRHDSFVPSATSLQSVYKFRILTIREIEELLILQLHITWFSPHFGLLAVLPPTVAVDEKHI